MIKNKEVYPLSKIKRGEFVKIVTVPHGILKAQFVRLGIHEGEKVKCLERLPGGTIVLQKNRQHIAVGNKLAEQIGVKAIGIKGMTHE